MKRAVANDGGNTKVKIQHRCKTQVNTHRQHFTGHQPARLLRQCQCSRGIIVVQLSQHTDRWQAKESVTKTLYTPSFLIDGNQ